MERDWSGKGFGERKEGGRERRRQRRRRKAMGPDIGARNWESGGRNEEIGARK